MPLVRSPQSYADQIRNLLPNWPRPQNSSVTRLNSLPIRRRPHHHESAECHERPAEPNPPNQRIESHPDFGAIGSPNAGEDDVDILLERSFDPDFGRWLERRSASRIDVLSLLTRDNAVGPSIARDVERNRSYLAIQHVV